MKTFSGFLHFFLPFWTTKFNYLSICVSENTMHQLCCSLIFKDNICPALTIDQCGTNISLKIQHRKNVSWGFLNAGLRHLLWRRGSEKSQWAPRSEPQIAMQCETNITWKRKHRQKMCSGNCPAYFLRLLLSPTDQWPVGDNNNPKNQIVWWNSKAVTSEKESDHWERWILPEIQTLFMPRNSRLRF